MATFHSMKNGKFAGEKYVQQQREKERRSAFKRGEHAGLLLSAALFVYSMAAWDIPLAFFLLGFMSIEVHFWIERTEKKNLSALGNGAKVFGIMMVIGSILMLFT